MKKSNKTTILNISLAAALTATILLSIFYVPDRTQHNVEQSFISYVKILYGKDVAWPKCVVSNNIFRAKCSTIKDNVLIEANCLTSGLGCH